MKVDVLKALLESAKAKVYLFGATVGGSFAILIKDNPLIIKILVALSFLFGFIGFFKNLRKLSKIEKELERIKDD